MALVGWWPLDGNTNYYSVNNRTLTNNGAVVSTGGKIGSTYLFSTNGMLMPSIPLPVNQNLYELSITAWIFPTETPPAHGYNIVSLSQNSGIRFRLDTLNRIWLYYYNGTTNYSFTSTAVELNKWTHISVILKEGELSVYINGVKDNSSTASSFIYISSSGNGSIGQYTTSSEVWKGYLNDIRIYDNALSQKEINELAKAKVLHYVFNKDESIVYDNSGYKRDGNKVNSPTFVEGRLGSGSYRFADISKYIQSPYGLGINPTVSGYTFSIWIKITSTANQMFFHTPNGSSQRFYIGIDSGKWDMGIQGVAWGTGVTTAVNNQWSHIVVTMSGGFAKMYVNGIYSFQKTYTSYTFPDNLRIGSRSDYITSDSLDDVRIYATALSDADILDLYQTRAKIDNQGNLYANEFVEDYEITNNITLLSQYDKETNRVTHSSFLARSGALLEKFDNYARVLAQNQFSFISQTLSLTAGKKYYIAGSLKTTSSLVRLISFNGQSDTTAIPQKLGEYTLVSNYITCQNSITNNIYINQFRDNRSSGFDYFFVRDTVFIEVTDIFGAGSEPTKEQLDAWYRDYSQSRTKSNGQIITNGFNEVGIDTIAYEGKTYREIFEFDDDFSGNTLDTTKWDILSPSGLTVNVSEGTIKLTKNSSGLSGIISKVSVVPGKKIVVRSRVTAGRHGSLISLGRGTFFPYPHAGSANSTFGVSLYGRHEIATSTSSARGENNITSVADNLGNPNEFLVYEIHYVSTNQMLVYRNGILVHTVNGLFNNTYFPYFTVDNGSLPNGLEVDYIYSTPLNIFTVQPTQAQMDLLYAQYRQLKTEEQALRIFKDKIHIQGSLNEGGQ
jgi:hypothetical protein